MVNNIIKPNIYIEFDIVKNSDVKSLITEFQYMIGLGKIIIIWSKFYSIKEMLDYCSTLKIEIVEKIEETIHNDSDSDSSTNIITKEIKKTVSLAEYIWDYKLKDSFLYADIDILVDNDIKLVNLFQKYNKIANYVERIE